MKRALVLAALPLALAACGGSSHPSSSSQSGAGSSLQSVQAAAKKTAGATSEHLNMLVAATVQGQTVKINGDGVFDNTKHRGSLTVHAAVNGLDLKIDEVLDKSILYMKSDFFVAMLPKGIDFDSLISQDPSRNFSELQALGDVTKIGDETVDGAPSTHYRGRIDISKLPQGLKIQRTTGVKYGPYDVWVGKDDGLVHRLKTTYSYDVGGQRQSATLTMNFFDFGNAVTVNVPPAADAADVSQQNLGSLGG